MARVNVEQVALTDPRMKHLGKLLGGDNRLAIGHMVYVWNECQERNTYTLTANDLAHITDVPGFAKFLIASKLGRRQGRQIYIAGAKGRVEWLGKARENGGKGGRPKGSRNKNHTVLKTEPSGSGNQNPPPPSPAPALTPALEEMVPSSPSLPGDGVAALDVLRWGIERLMPQAYYDEVLASLWLRDINPDPWWILAALCEQADHLAKARMSSYATKVLLTAKTDGWATEDPKGYVSYALSDRRLKAVTA